MAKRHQFFALLVLDRVLYGAHRVVDGAQLPAQVVLDVFEVEDDEHQKIGMAIESSLQGD